MVTVPLVVFGCSSGYYDTTLSHLDYNGQQRPASIQVSDPQLYKREDLINERREEIEYLKDLLNKSRTIEFAPELLRDIETVTSLALQLGLSFDAGAKLQFSQAAQLSDLEQQIAVTKLQTQLAQLRRDLDLLQSSLAAQTTPSGAAGTTTSTTALPDVKPPGLSDAKELATRLENLVKGLTDRLDKSSTAPRITSASASPRELFQDRQAYRRDLQSALNAVALDTLHDIDANSLFRLQFHATILPGEAASELGVLQMQIQRPSFTRDITDADLISKLYFEWLDHVTHRLNEVSDADTIRRDPVLLRLSGRNNMFTILACQDTQNTRNDITECQEVSNVRDIKQVQTDTPLVASPPNVTRCKKETLQRGFRAATSQFSQLTGDKGKRITAKALQTQQKIQQSIQQEPCTPAELAAVVPNDFIKALFEEGPNAQLTAKGRVSTYAVSPIALVQRVSTAARAAEAIQIAASLAASLPVKGLGANAALGSMRSVTGKVDALERVPLVVGYSTPALGTDKPTIPAFGWLLGPKVVLNAEKKALALEHNLAPYELTADVSMPGWWPYIYLIIQASWAPDWRTNRAQTVVPETEPDKQRMIRVPMRHTQGDLDGITTLVAQYLEGPRAETASIGRVEPSVISACASSVALLVRGSNIWRAQDAYLLGLRGQNLTVLPDMAGISVSFDIANLSQRPTTFVQPRLLVATPNGLASADLTIQGSRLKGCGGEGIVRPDPDDGSPAITAILPGTVYACDANVRLVIIGKHFNEAKLNVSLGSIVGTPSDLSEDGTRLVVSFATPIGRRGGKQTTLPLIVTTTKGIDSKDVTIERDDCTHPSSVSKPTAVVPLSMDSLDLCAKEAKLLVVGDAVRKIDGAHVISTSPKFDVAAQAIKVLPQAQAAELTFVGIPRHAITGPNTFKSPVQAVLYVGKQPMTTFEVPAVCSQYQQ
jgi:hypothetical protein